MSRTCSKCQSKKVARSVEGHRLIYQCHQCGQNWDEAFLRDPGIKIISTSQGIKHITVGALIRHRDKVLLVEDDFFPHKLQLPANHLCRDETLERGLERMIDDLLGVEISASSLLSQIELPTPDCPYGADAEEWAVFDVEINENDLVASNPTQLIAWLSMEDIDTKKLTDKTIYALQAIGYLRPDKSRDNSR